MSDSEDQQSYVKTLALVGQLGLGVVASIFLFGLLGFKLGQAFGYDVEGLLVGVIFGVLIGFMYTYKKILKAYGIPEKESKE